MGKNYQKKRLDLYKVKGPAQVLTPYLLTH
jgi:hypothetical protein